MHEVNAKLNRMSQPITNLRAAVLDATTKILEKYEHSSQGLEIEVRCQICSLFTARSYTERCLSYSNSVCPFVRLYVRHTSVGLLCQNE